MFPVIRALIVKTDMQLTGCRGWRRSHLLEASVKSREPTDLYTTLYSVFSDIGALNFQLAFIYLFVSNFMGSGITSENKACDDTE